MLYTIYYLLSTIAIDYILYYSLILYYAEPMRPLLFFGVRVQRLGFWGSLEGFAGVVGIGSRLWVSIALWFCASVPTSCRATPNCSLVLEFGCVARRQCHRDGQIRSFLLRSLVENVFVYSCLSGPGDLMSRVACLGMGSI